MSSDPGFRLVIQDVFSIRGRGTVVTGSVENGTVSSGDRLRLHHGGAERFAIVQGIEMNQSMASQASSGDLVGLLLQNVEKKDVQRGDVLTGGA